MFFFVSVSWLCVLHCSRSLLFDLVCVSGVFCLEGHWQKKTSKNGNAAFQNKNDGFKEKATMPDRIFAHIAA